MPSVAARAAAAAATPTAKKQSSASHTSSAPVRSIQAAAGPIRDGGSWGPMLMPIFGLSPSRPTTADRDEFSRQ
jgi:hypothetical protein